ncbi:hypothetical protein GQ55_5G501900 [Panicum hallii var. hallii]|uniref:Uncharacterized protein n=1 Tax=Panicum hallii var. hallii TaxID=1504633 RepID=A0A2T7DRY8_9POAL|nr:hypothetical protein GQ55_5G501900 [Panicum hallii var. hallii]
MTSSSSAADRVRFGKPPSICRPKLAAIWSPSNPRPRGRHATHAPSAAARAGLDSWITPERRRPLALREPVGSPEGPPSGLVGSPCGVESPARAAWPATFPGSFSISAATCCCSC